MLTIASAILAWSSYRASDRLEVLRQKEQPLRDLRGEIALYDEILTSSAVLAATTGDAQWEERYHQHEALLDAALAKAAKLDPESATAIEALDAANRELVVLEKRAFDLGRAGQTAEARSLLTGDDYRHFKGNYSASLAQLNRHLDEHSRRALSEAQQEAHLFTLLAFLVAGVVVVLLLAGAVATFSSLRMR
jgi:CHASE3 domain sensor protein